jgi:hypothetical protein
MRRLVTLFLVIPLLSAVAFPVAGQSPTTTEELLSGMVTEEIEPGVYRIINDGVRDLAPPEVGDWGVAVNVDGAGSVWRIQDGRYFRLGGEGEWPIGDETDLGRGLAIADGRLVAASDLSTLLPGPSPTTMEDLGSDSVSAFGAQADGTLWVLGEGGSLVRVPPGGVAEVLDWKDVYDGLVGGLAVTPDGDAWLMGRPEVGRYPAEVLLHFDGDEWEVVPVPTELLTALLWAGPLTSDKLFDVGPDGTLWADWDYGRVGPHRSLTRYDGSGWATFGEADGVRPWGEQWVYGWNAQIDVVRVAPDGSVWVIATSPGEDRCGGIGRFDGESWASYLRDMCIASYDIAPDGAVWVVASERQGGYTLGTHVITPEAVAGTE